MCPALAAVAPLASPKAQLRPYPVRYSHGYSYRIFEIAFSRNNFCATSFVLPMNDANARSVGSLTLTQDEVSRRVRRAVRGFAPPPKAATRQLWRRNVKLWHQRAILRCLACRSSGEYRSVDGARLRSIRAFAPLGFALVWVFLLCAVWATITNPQNLESDKTISLLPFWLSARCVALRLFAVQFWLVSFSYAPGGARWLRV